VSEWYNPPPTGKYMLQLIKSNTFFALLLLWEEESDKGSPDFLRVRCPPPYVIRKRHRAKKK
jgi:hypothetical protein